MELELENKSEPIIIAYEENRDKSNYALRKKSLTKALTSEIIEVSTHVGCPCNCLKYCPQEVTLSRYKGERSFSRQSFQHALASVPEYVEIRFSGFCEPFTNRSTIDLMQYAYDCGHQVSLYSTFYGASAEDIEQLANIPLSIFCLHLWDGEVMNFQLTQEYMKNVFKAIQVVKAENSQVMFMKKGAFKTCNRENFVRKLTRKSHSVGYCPVLKDTDFVLLPNGNVQLCCMDFGLEHTLGNLLKEDYGSIKARFNKTKHFSLCERCSYSITPVRHNLRRLMGLPRKHIRYLREG